MLSRFLSCLLLGAAVAMGSDSVWGPGYACQEQELTEAAATEATALFEHYFGKEMSQTREQWDAERGAYYFAFLSRSKTGEPVLHECVWLLSADGNTLRYLTCQKFADGTRAGFAERVQQAVVPYMFLKIESDRAYFSWWNPTPNARNTIHVEQRSAPFSSYSFPFTRTCTPEELDLVWRYIGKETPDGRMLWDAENKIGYKTKRQAYQDVQKVEVALEVFSEDESSFRLISFADDTLRNGAPHGRVWEYKRLAPGVYVSVWQSDAEPNTDTLTICIVEKDAQTGQLTRKSSHFYNIPTQSKWAHPFMPTSMERK